MTSALVLADDFTGAMDTGYGFASRGIRTRVSLRSSTAQSVAASDRATVLAIDANTRDADRETAAATVSDLLESVEEPSLVYDKIDSTLRGHVVAEMDAAIDAIDADVAVVAPAFPSTGRTTVDGHHFVDGVSVDEAGYDVTTGELADFFRSSEYGVRLLDHEIVDDGPAAVVSTLTEYLGEDPVVITCDATRDCHLRSIAEGADRLEATVLFVGSGGLASAVPVSDSESADDAPLDHPDGGQLAVVGSVNDRTLAQLETVPSNLLVHLDPSEAVRDPEMAGQSAADELTARLRERGRAVVTAARSSDDIERARATAATLEVDAGPRIDAALASAATTTHSDTPVSGLFLTGGSVARAVLDALSATAIDLTGESVGEGIPVGRIVDGSTTGATVVTKAGGFGTDGSIVNCLNFLGSTNGSL